MLPPFDDMHSTLRFLAPLTLLIVISTGCGSRRELFTAAPRAPAPSAGRADTSRGDRAAERVKEAIKSLRREVSKRSPGTANSPADLPPIPLIKPLAHERIVGTSGAWSVVQTTQTTPLTLRTSERKYGQSWRDRAHLNRDAIWLLLLGAAVLVGTLLTLRAQRVRHRSHG